MNLADYFIFSKENILQFNSVYFFIAFISFFLVYTLVFNKKELRNTLLLIFSLFVYYKMTGAYLIVLLLLSVLQFFIGKKIFATNNENQKRIWLWVGLLPTISSLLYFKYTAFFAEMFGMEIQWTILAPIGISYYVFKSIS